MRVKLLTFRYSATLGAFDDIALADFIRDKCPPPPCAFHRPARCCSPARRFGRSIPLFFPFWFLSFRSLRPLRLCGCFFLFRAEEEKKK